MSFSVERNNGLAGFVIFMQRFGSAGNLNVHLHIIALDGAYVQKSTGRLKFIPASAPTEESTTRLVMDIAGRINRHLILITAKENDIEPVKYLSDLLQNLKHVNKNPHAWLPWNYHQTLEVVSMGPPEPH